MNVSDLIVEVRDRDLDRVAQFTEDDLAGLTVVIRANSVGLWEAVLPATVLRSTGEREPNPVAEALRAEGAGIIVQTATATLLSGPMTEAQFAATADDPDGVWTISGVSDAILLADALAYPQPGNANPATQAVANDTRTATAEDLLRRFVAYNIANGAIASPVQSWAPAGRLAGLRTKLRLQGSSQGRGPTLTFSPRFENLLSLCQSIAAQGGLGFDVVQVGSLLEFVVTTPADRSAFVSMDVENEQLAAVGFGVGSPSTTVAIVGGQGEGVARSIVQVTSTESLSAETSWGRRIERFVDQRQAEVTAELTQTGSEVIAAGGSTVASVKATPSDDLTDVFMVDWKVGDLVTVVVRETPMIVPVAEATLRVSEQGVLVGVTLGDPTGFEPEDVVYTRQEDTETRVSALERNAEGGASTQVFDSMPAGSMVAWAASSIPTGWLVCDGSAVSRTTYSALFAVIGTTYGAGDGSTTFNLPDMRGRVAVGRDSAQTEFDTLGEAGGAKTHTLTAAEIPAHTHSVSATTSSDGAHTHPVGGTGTAFVANGSGGSSASVGTGTGYQLQAPQSAGAHSHTFSTTSGANTGGGGAHNNLQPYRVVNYIIKFTTAQVPGDSQLEPRITSLETSPTFSGEGTGPRLRLTSTTDVTLTSTGHALQIGPTSGQNLAIDVNEIQSRSNGAASGLALQAGGGDIQLGTSASTVTLGGRLDATHLPYAMAAGRAVAPSGGTLVGSLYYSTTFTVTLPASRFTVAPRVVAGASGLGVLYASVTGTPTTTSFTAVVTRLNASLAANSHYLEWTAIQMTSTAAEG